MVYFIKCGNFVKIGFSKNPRERLNCLQTANPNKLKLIATIKGNFKTEKGLHEAFSKYRHNREWFRYDGHLKACIMALKDNFKPIDIVDVRSLQQAGLHLQVRQKLNRHKVFKQRFGSKKN